MGFDRIRIKSNARLFYKNNTGTSICSLLIYMGIIFGAVIAFTIIGVAAGLTAGGDEDPAYALAVNFFSLVVSIATMPLAIGLMGWYRRSIYEKVPLSELFCFYREGRFMGAVGTQFLVSLYIWLWSFLLVIPGIIKSYSYSQAVFIKAENPNISASRAIELSKKMMEGHKWDMFVLHLSFLGWALLSSITYHILGIVYVFPYFYAALAFAYEEIKADAASRGVIDIHEISGYDNYYGSGEPDFLRK